MHSRWCLPILMVAIPVGAVVPSGRAAAGPRTISDGGKCQLTVPTGWETGKVVKTIADSPDGSAGAAISSDDDATVAELKSVAESAFKPAKVFADTSRRFWYQFTYQGRIRWYVVIPRKGGTCHADIFFTKPGQAAMARQIVRSVRPVRPVT